MAGPALQYQLIWPDAMTSFQTQTKGRQKGNLPDGLFGNFDYLSDNKMTRGRDANASNRPFPAMNRQGDNGTVYIPINTIPIPSNCQSIAESKLRQLPLEFRIF
jgi:hypothetical protein